MKLIAVKLLQIMDYLLFQSSRTLRAPAVYAASLLPQGCGSDPQAGKRYTYIISFNLRKPYKEGHRKYLLNRYS